MDLGLKDKRAVVTGASRGLGFATARLLSREGARVAVNSRSPEKLNAAARIIKSETANDIYAIPGDLIDPSFADQLIKQAAEMLGGIDLLFTNAGGPPPGKFESFDDKAWQQALETSFLSHVRLIRAALPYLRTSAYPSVLAVTSFSVKQPIPNLILSNSVRLATVGLIKTLALELGSAGIRFNSILPGSTETERILHLFSDRAAASGSTEAEERARTIQEIPLGRIGTPDEFANAAVFLLSPAASFITGVMLAVDGGSIKGTM
jgi:3-oxoacyl-[acyl-carrier protein] reductase